MLMYSREGLESVTYILKKHRWECLNNLEGEDEIFSDFLRKNFGRFARATAETVYIKSYNVDLQPQYYLCQRLN
jgi:hypothetical protein